MQGSYSPDTALEGFLFKLPGAALELGLSLKTDPGVVANAEDGSSPPVAVQAKASTTPH